MSEQTSLGEGWWAGVNHSAVFISFILESCSSILQQDNTTMSLFQAALVFMFIDVLLCCSADLCPFQTFNVDG